MKKISGFLSVLFCFLFLFCGCGKTNDNSGNTISIDKANVGDLVKLGKFEQDNNYSNGSEDIIWKVIERTPYSILLLSQYSLDFQEHFSNSLSSNDKTLYTYINSKIRTWLNNDFYNYAFSEQEKNIIGLTKIASNVNDKIFLLSSTEVIFYLGNKEDRICPPSKYAENKGATKNWWTRESSDGGDAWWIRYKFVGGNGEISNWGYGGYNKLAVRPALRVYF